MTSCVSNTQHKIRRSIVRHLDMIELSIWYFSPNTKTRLRFRWCCRRVWRGGESEARRTREEWGPTDPIRANRNGELNGCEGNHFRSTESRRPRALPVLRFLPTLKWSCVLIKGKLVSHRYASAAFTFGFVWCPLIVLRAINWLWQIALCQHSISIPIWKRQPQLHSFPSPSEFLEWPSGALTARLIDTFVSCHPFKLWKTLAARSPSKKL